MLKQKIPKALREQVWLKFMGKQYQGKCTTKWCANIITVFDFEAGHNIPESKGGTTTINNLFPICARCNRSMNNKFTIDEWNRFDEETIKNKGTTSMKTTSSCCCIVM